MGFPEAELNAKAEVTTDAATWIGIVTDDPGDTGANEVTGGTYARKQTTWGSPSAGSVVGSQVEIDIPAGTTAAGWGLFTAETAGSCKFSELFTDAEGDPAPEVFTNAGTIKVTPTVSDTEV